ncbi:MAG: pyridoxine 5'-phosphate synthase, partial [Magnetovibrio sp.]|nr:pyridoxine 5'-phosphate synthase [Magnetovibrio sp.]
GGLPDLLGLSRQALAAGADGITVHPRPDQRHIRFSDLADLKGVVQEFCGEGHAEFNIEGNPSPEFIQLVLAHAPDQVTLVPDAPDAFTSDAGWDVLRHAAFLSDVIKTFKNAVIRVSLFVDADPRQIEAAAGVGADRVELYTGPYADACNQGHAEFGIRSFINAAQTARAQGLGVNAGHDLNKSNLKLFSRALPDLDEVSIGHALIADALEMGMINAVRAYKGKLKSHDVPKLRPASISATY